MLLDKEQLEEIDREIDGLDAAIPYIGGKDAARVVGIAGKLLGHIQALQEEVDRRGNLMLETQWQPFKGMDYCIYCDEVKPKHEFDCDIRDVKFAPPDR